MVRQNQSCDTIKDFGDQWGEFTENTGYYASMDALESLIEPLLHVSDLRDKYIADVGAGTGRYTRLFHEAGAEKIFAIEPSGAFKVLKHNTADLSGIVLLNKKAEEIPADNFDLIFCIGVLQFIPDPRTALKAMGRALGKDGRLFVWVYSEEKNGLYLSLIKPLRRLTSKMPHGILKYISAMLLPLAELYGVLSLFCPFIPMAEYLKKYFLRMNRYSRRLIIHDQLNPKFAKYYKKDELKELFNSCGFTDIRIHHRMGYSWSICAKKM